MQSSRIDWDKYLVERWASRTVNSYLRKSMYTTEIHKYWVWNIT